jgi:hypothetical protein
MRIFRTLLAASVGASTLALGLVAPASAASAAPQAAWQCAASSFCVYANSNGNALIAGLGPGGVFVNLGTAGFGDMVSSARNTGSSVGVLWDYSSSAGCWVLLLTVAPGAEVNVPLADNDRTDAISHLGYNPPNVCNV